MKVNELIEQLKHIYENCNILKPQYVRESIAEAIKLIESFNGKMVTTPPEYKVNPNYQNLGKNHHCASCGVMFIDWENAPTNYCGNCGQKLREVSHEQ